MGILLFIAALVIGFVFLLYKASHHESTLCDEQRQRAQMMNDSLHRANESAGKAFAAANSACAASFAAEKSYERKHDKRIKYVEPSSNRLVTEIMGLRYRSAEAKLAAKDLVPGDILHLMMEPKNKHDKFAVKILTEDDIHIGYVQAEYSEFVTRYFDCMLECRVSCVPDEVEKLVWGIPQSYCAVLFFTEDVEIPDND